MPEVRVTYSMRSVVVVVGSLLAVASCGPAVGGGGGGGGGGEEERGDFGTGDFGGVESGSVDQDDPLDCVEGVIRGNFSVLAENIDEPGGCLACAPVGMCMEQAHCGAGRCSYTPMRPGPGYCLLECEDDGDCTEGRRCLDLPDDQGGRVKLCGDVSDDPFACASVAGDPCEGAAGPESCEAVASTSWPGLACKWLEERVLGSDGSCEPIDLKGYCVAMVERDETDACVAADSCRSDGVSVWWRDYGAGTVGVAASPPNWTIFASRNGAPSELCDFGGAAALPDVCGCL